MRSRKYQVEERQQSRSKAEVELIGPTGFLSEDNRDEYDQLFRRMTVAIKPQDGVEELFVEDISRLQWDIRRWRRFEAVFLHDITARAFGEFAIKNLAPAFAPYWKHFQKALKQRLTELLELQAEYSSSPENSAHSAAEPPASIPNTAEDLAHRFAEFDPEAEEEVNRIFTEYDEEKDYALMSFTDFIKKRYVEDLTKSFVRHDPRSIKVINDLLDCWGTNLERLRLEALQRKVYGGLHPIETLEHLRSFGASAERRRNIVLRELDNYRHAFGKTVRAYEEDIEEPKPKLIEAPALSETAPTA